LMSFNLLIFPSTTPLLSCKVRPARTASLSRWMRAAQSVATQEEDWLSPS
jgi:hypothetical protein